MIKDITLGQFFPGNSIIHKLDPRLKVALTVAYIVMIFVAKGLVSYLFILLSLIAVIIVSKISIRLILKSLKPLFFILIFTAVINSLYTPGQIIFTFYFINITKEGMIISAFMLTRIIMLIAGSSILTYTTSPTMLTDAIESLCKPLKIFKLPINEFAMMMSIALRFIPTLIEETDKIIKAQKSRDRKSVV